MTILQDSSLEFARAHLEAYYDSDFFPKPDELQVLWGRWPEVKKHLATKNVSKLETQQPRTMPAPKVRGGYRFVHQLEPLDALAYTALAHSIAEPLQQARQSSADGIAFSYRVQLTDNNFFGDGNGYAAFIERCRDLASQYTHVLCTDIADFYNRIYTHRIENNITGYKLGSEDLARDVETFLMGINGKASQGVPVGPAASIILSEALLLDVDEFIKDAGLVHCRYVDDIRIFANHPSSLRQFEEKLCYYLYDNHRLQLASQKTLVQAATDFAQSITPPEAIERRDLLAVARQVCPYGDTITEEDVDDLTKRYLSADAHAARTRRSALLGDMLRVFLEYEDVEEKEVRGRLVEELYNEGATSSPIDLGLTRHALRLARRLRANDLVSPVLRDFSKLGAVLPDLFLYLDAVITPSTSAPHLPALRGLLTEPLFLHSRFAQHWLFWFATRRRELVTDPTFAAAIFAGPVEFQARAAALTQKLSWLRANKSRLSGFGRWDRRAFLMAWRVMPKAERNAWLTTVSPADVLEEWVIDWARTERS